VEIPRWLQPVKYRSWHSGCTLLKRIYYKS